VSRTPTTSSAGDLARRPGAAIGSTRVTPSKKLLFVFGSLERAGAQLRTLEVVEGLRRRHALEFDFCSIGLGPKPNEIQHEVELLGGSTRLVTIRSLRFPFRFARLLRDGGYDVINTEPQLLSGLVVWLASRRRVPVRIVTIHNSIGDPGQSATSRIVRMILSHRLFVWAMRSLITRHATCVIAVSRSALDSVLPGRWQSTGSSCVVYNGTDPASFQQPSEAGDVRREFGWPADSRIVVNVGRFSDQKNHAAILETMRLVHERDPLVRLLLIGGGSLRGDIERTIDRLGIRVVSALTSNRSDMGRLLAASDVFFFPSAWEGLPGAPIEALAAGLPLVASDIPSMREIAAYFPGDISMAPPNDIRQHAENIRRALDEPTDESRSRRRRRFASSPFTLETALATYCELYGLDSRENSG
jgi:glycosyltransferase involved in cell wall biosynthesis